ncbi:MAG: iron ABC transporter permease [Corticimicrobacter sp.]|uniref:FecCD family ABC transporter permease n=1 Tax=Corticimicrobacter sp. TaxID=2678536 RepID=UPI0032DABCF1
MPIRSIRTGLVILPVLLVFSICFALTVGRYPLTLTDILAWAGTRLDLTSMAQDSFQTFDRIIMEVRLPRILAAALVGAALASSGCAFQAVFRNPLVSPGILGVLSGASFGAALGMLVLGNWLYVQLSAFGMGLLAVGLGVLVARLFGGGSLIMLVLGGMISAALFTSGLSIVKYLADPYEQLPSLIYWLMGSLGGLDWLQIQWASGPILVGIFLLALSGRALDALTMGDDEARTLGIPVAFVRYGVIGAATLVSSLSVSLVGMIGWLGLVIPHVARLLFGPGNVGLIPGSALLGAIFLVCVDTLARSLTHAELPIGVLTDLLGIPLFLLVLGRARRAWT